MKKVHLCCGDIYLLDYENCDITGKYSYECSNEEMNLNSTTLEKYFKYPFRENSKQRPPKIIIVNRIMKILEKWSWENGSVDEIVMINSFEHFWHTTEIPHIIKEAERVLTPGGVFKFDFPDVLEIIRKYNKANPRFMMELIYGSRKNQYSAHEWGYTKETIYDFFPSNKWEIKFRNIVTHDYPSQGVFAIKKGI